MTVIHSTPKGKAKSIESEDIRQSKKKKTTTTKKKTKRMTKKTKEEEEDQNRIRDCCLIFSLDARDQSRDVLDDRRKESRLDRVQRKNHD